MAKHDKIMPCDHKEAIGDINKYWEKLKNLGEVKFFTDACNREGGDIGLFITLVPKIL